MALQVTFNTQNFSYRLQYWLELYLTPSVKVVFFLWKLHRLKEGLQFAAACFLASQGFLCSITLVMGAK